MARDPRKNSAYDSGMRGREKPSVSSKHGGTMGSSGGAGGEAAQGAGKTIGDPEGVMHTDSAYSSGMRGIESPKQKAAATGRSGSGDATYGQTDVGAGGGENKQKANTQIGVPDGEDTSKAGAISGVSDAQKRAHPTNAYKMGIPGNNTEDAALGDNADSGFGAEEDDTHINIRVPKASLKKKAAGLPAPARA